MLLLANVICQICIFFNSSANAQMQRAIRQEWLKKGTNTTGAGEAVEAGQCCRAEQYKYSKYKYASTQIYRVQIHDYANI